MSIIKLTQDLENFKWTDYSKVGTPQSFYDGHSKIVTGQKTFNRPDKQALADMESRFGPFDTQPPDERGPYGIADYMDGRQRGRGFTAPGQAPLGFTVDMESLTGGVTSQLYIDGSISLTPLSHVVAGVNSSLDYGVVPEKMIMLGPAAEGAWGVKTLPISTYSSRILSREELEGYTNAPVGGRVYYYGRLESLYNKDSMFQKEDGTYSTPTGQDLTVPGSPSEFQNFMEYGGRGIQRTFEVPREYPFHTTAYTIDTQFGRTWEDNYFSSHGSYLTDKIPIDKYASNPVKIRGELDLLFNLNWNESDNIWPYGVLGYSNPNTTGPHVLDNHPFIRKTVGQRYEIPGDFFDKPDFSWMALQLKRTAEDTTRINKWLATPEGELWEEKQHILQNLNPREETRDWSRSNLILSIPPFIHATRHFGGETYMDKADFGPIFEGDPPQGTSIGSLFAGTKFGKWVGKVATKVGDLMEGADTAIGGAVAGIDSFFGGIDFNKEGGRLQFLTDKMIKQIPDDGGFGGLMTNMRSAHTPFGRPPKVPTQTVFSQKGAYGVGDVHKGGANFDPTTGNTLQSYKGVAYGNIGKNVEEGNDSPFYRDPTPMEKPDWIDVRPNSMPDLSSPDALTKNFGLKMAKGGFSRHFSAISQFDAMTDKYNDQALARKNKEETDALIESWPKDRDRPMESLGMKGKWSKSTKTVGDTSKGDRGGADLGLIKKDNNSKSYKSMATDKINIHPYGKDLPEDVSDFIKFKFKDIVNNKFIIFRAILSGISDAITPEWAGTQFIGRPDKVYVYQGTERKISFTFEIFPKTKQEFPVLLEKLNYLVGLCYPTFTGGNRMIAPFIELTLGDMFHNTPGFLDSLSVDVDDNSPWEIEEGLQFPHHITCQCSFTYIGKYLPSTLGKHYELDWLKDKGWASKGDNKMMGTFQIGTDGKIQDTNKPQRTEPMKTLFDKLGV